MKTQRLRFRNSRGIELGGRLDLPDQAPVKAYALFGHCFTCHKDYKFIRHISRTLTERGIAVLCIDFTGLGESGGRFEDSNFTTSVDDVVSAARYLTATHGAPELLIGHSLGGTVMLAAAQGIPRLRAVATINAPFEPRHIFQHLAGILEQVEQQGEAQAVIGGVSHRITRQLLDDLRGQSIHDSVRGLNAALLVLHAPLDETVGIDNAGRIFEAARHPKSFIALDRADHLLSRAEDARYAGQVIAAWALPYLGAGDGGKTDAAGRHGWVTVRTGVQGYLSEIATGGHHLVADEPEAAGGTNLGPSPYELLAASLGACTCITLRMYADRKQWPLTGIAVYLKHEKIHAKDCEDCPDSHRQIDQITGEIELSGPLSAEQRQRLLEIAARCPVHKTLRAGIRVEAQLKA